MIEKCKYCGFYSNNINDNSLRDGYCFLEDVGNYCKRNENDYCSKFVFAGCKSCINNIELTENELNKMFETGELDIKIKNNQVINKCRLNQTCMINGVCQQYSSNKEV